MHWMKEREHLWTVLQPITEFKRGRADTFALTHMGNLVFQVGQDCTFLDCERKPQYLEESL